MRTTIPSLPRLSYNGIKPTTLYNPEAIPRKESPKYQTLHQPPIEPSTVVSDTKHRARVTLDHLQEELRKAQLAEQKVQEKSIQTFNTKLFLLRNMTSSNSSRKRAKLVQELQEMLKSHNLNEFRLPQASIDEFYKLIGKEVNKNLNHVINKYI